MKSIEQLISESRMSSRPAFYSGRGVATCDLDVGQLLIIYRGIQKEYGESAGKAYILMIKELPLLTATDFLLSLHYLASHNFEEVVVFNDKIAIEKNEKGEHNMLQAMASLFSVNRYSPERAKEVSDEIKYCFFQNVGLQPKIEEKFVPDRDGLHGYYKRVYTF
jgi:hypothetical protein